MSETFRNAPLLELIAEVRWQPPYASAPTVPPQPGVPVPLPLLLSNVQIDNFLHKFGGEVYKRGFQRMERVYPSGLPAAQGQIIARYKSDNPDYTNIIYQVGVGLFSANAVPPYRSWKEFRPAVEVGVETLLQTRDPNEQAIPFSPVSLRYIDSFKSDLTGGRDVSEFLSDVLKIQLNFPKTVAKHLEPGKSAKPYVMLTLPTKNGSLQLNVGEALVNGATTILLDMTFSTTPSLKPEKSAILSSFDLGHSVIHDIFIELTAPIRDLMQPEQ